MSNVVKNTEEQLRQMLAAAVKTAVTAGELPDEQLPEYIIEVPADRKNGDLAANIAMVSARAFRCAPRKIADTIAAHIVTEGTYFSSVEVAGPGFMNFFLSPNYYGDVVLEAI
jgi:arginyl-tRNA synthetase